MTKVVVPRLPAGPGPAETALTEQGIEYEWRPVGEGTEYGHMLAALWREQEGFIMLEHDIVPWPGAIAKLAVCREPWCTHAYPGPQLFMSIGVTKLTTDALQASQELPELWEGEHWGSVDLKVIPALHSRFPLHGHYPPFAHTRFQ